MKRIIAFILCLMMILSLAACGGNETAGQSDSTAAQAGTAGTAEDTPESGEITLSADNSEATETTEATEATETVMEEVPIPENTAVTKTTDGQDKQVTEFSGNVVYQNVADYAALLESMGFTVKEEFRNDGTYYVIATKDKVSIYSGLAHGIRDDIFLDKIAQGEEVKGNFSGSITVEK